METQIFNLIKTIEARIGKSIFKIDNLRRQKQAWECSEISDAAFYNTLAEYLHKK